LAGAAGFGGAGLAAGFFAPAAAFF